jgi:hypothetical protein
MIVDYGTSILANHQTAVDGSYCHEVNEESTMYKRVY